MSLGRLVARQTVNVVLALGAVAMLGFVFFPIYFLLVSSLRSPQDLFTAPTLIPVPPSWHFYSVAINETQLVLWTRNSFLVVVGTVALTLPVAILGAFAIGMFRFRGRAVAGRLMLLLYLFPSVLLLVPLFVLLAQLRLVNSLPALIVAHATFALPFSVWYLSAYFRTIPRELYDAGLVDGCNQVNVLWRVLLPVATPGIAATVAFVFMSSWNEYAFAVTMIQSADIRTLPLGVASYFSAQGISWGVVLATSVLMSIPVVVAVLLMQRYFIAGLSAGSVTR